jgi:RNA polymerase sigma factor (TIGR02999 family)
LQSLSHLLQAFRGGDRESARPIEAYLHEEFKRLALGQLKAGFAHASLEPTALVHEAWIRLQGVERLEFADRRAFFAFAAKAMRSILADRARAAQALRRGGDRVRLQVLPEEPAQKGGELDLLDLENALGRLAALDPESAQIVELRFYGGLSHPEIAEHLGVSLRQVERRWSFARAWLHSALGGAP